VVFVDNGSTDETPDHIKEIKNVHAISNKANTGFARGCNQGAEIAHGEYLVFLNNDTYVLPGWLTSLFDTFNEHQKVGIAGSKLIYPDEKLAEAGSIVWKNKLTTNYGKYRNPDEYEFNYVKDVDYCSAASMILKKDVFKALNGLDVIFSPAYYEDTDFAFRIRKLGLRVVYQPQSEVIHIESLTAGTNDKNSQLAANREIFYHRWEDVLTRENFNNTDEDYFARDRSLPGKIILYIDHCIPLFDQDGASFITYQYLKAMKSLGYKIVFWPQDLNPVEPYTGILQQMGIEVVYGDVSFEKYMKKNGHYINTAFVSQPMGSLPYVDILKKYTKAKILYMAHDLHYLREMRGKASVNYGEEKEIEKTKKSEIELMMKSDKALFFSDKEVEYLKDNAPKITAECIPWTQEINIGKSEIRSENRKGLLFVGAFGHAPNIDAIAWFCKDIFPEIAKKNRRAELYIVGSNPTAQILKIQGNKIHVTGYVRDLKPYYDKAKVFIAPIRFGAGFKTKIAHAMSYGLPVVTTSIGAEGMGLTDGQNVLIADDAKTFAQKVIQLYFDNTMWEKLAINSVEHVSKNYSPEKAKNYLQNNLFLKNK
jgi:GT2 family glycosyltransferase